MPTPPQAPHCTLLLTIPCTNGQDLQQLHDSMAPTARYCSLFPAPTVIHGEGWSGLQADMEAEARDRNA